MVIWRMRELRKSPSLGWEGHAPSMQLEEGRRTFVRLFGQLD